MSRLDFAPSTRAMEVTDISTGHFVFSPLPDQRVSFLRLDETIRGAGYEIEKAWLQATGIFQAPDRLHVQIGDQEQVFQIGRTPLLEELQSGLQSGERVNLRGVWSEEGEVQILSIEEWSAEQ